MTPRRASGLLLLLLTLGCGVPIDVDARALDAEAAPYRVVTRPRMSAPAGSQRVVAFLVRDGALLPVPRRIAELPSPSAALGALRSGPTTAEQADGFSSALPLIADVRVVRVEDGLVTVDLPREPETGNRSDDVLGFGQIVLTLTALPTVTGVLFQRDGEPLQVPSADGALTAGPLGRVDYRDLIDPS